MSFVSSTVVVYATLPYRSSAEVIVPMLRLWVNVGVLGGGGGFEHVSLVSVFNMNFI